MADKFPKETEFRLSFTRAAVMLYKEWKKAAPRFGGQPFTLDFARTIARRGSHWTTDQVRNTIKRLVHAGVLVAELRDWPRDEVFIREWRMDLVRHPAIRPRVGDTGRRALRRKVGERQVTAVTLTEVTYWNGGKSVTVKTSAWCGWAKQADFTVKAVLGPATDVSGLANVSLGKPAKKRVAKGAA